MKRQYCAFRFSLNKARKLIRVYSLGTGNLYAIIPATYEDILNFSVADGNYLRSLLYRARDYVV